MKTRRDFLKYLGIAGAAPLVAKGDLIPENLPKTETSVLRTAHKYADMCSAFPYEFLREPRED